MSPLIPPEWESIEAPSMRVTPPGPRSREVLDRIEGTAYPGLSAGLTPLALDSKRAWTVTDLDGNVYLDCASASASVPLGAGRPELLAPVAAALERFGNEDSHALVCRAHRRARRAPARGHAEQPEPLRHRPQRHRGGRDRDQADAPRDRPAGDPRASTAPTTASRRRPRRSAPRRPRSAAACAALVPGFVHVPYPHPYRTPLRDPRPGGSGDATVDYIRDHLLFHALDPSEVAGVVIEPVLGSGGCVAPPDAFWPALTELCREHDWLLCADEVKTGIGRSGELFAVERWGVEPDLMCLGKALGGGAMPIGALLGSERALGGFDDVPTGSTWAWLPGLVRRRARDARPSSSASRCSRTCARSRRSRATRLGELRRSLRADRRRARGRLLHRDRVRRRPASRRSGPPSFRTRSPPRRSSAGVLADSSTTSLNVQPSLVMPPAMLERAFEILAESTRRRGGDRGARAMSDGAAIAGGRCWSALEAELRSELERMASAGTLKRIPVLDSPQGPVGRDRGPRRGALPLLERLPRARQPPGGGPRRRRGAGRVRRRDRLGALHLRQVRAPGRARARPGGLPRDRGGAHLRLLLDRQRGVARRALRPAHRGLLRPPQPRLDHRRDAARAPRPQGRLRARRHRRFAPGARRGAGAGSQADRHRRRLQHGGRPRAARRSWSTVAAEHGATLIVDDSHGIGVVGAGGRGRPRALRLSGLGGRDRHRHARQGPRRRRRRVRRRAPTRSARCSSSARARSCSPTASRRPSRPARAARWPSFATTPTSSPVCAQHGADAGRPARRRASSRSQGESAILPIIVGRDRRERSRSAAGCSTAASTSPGSATPSSRRGRPGSGSRSRPP